MEKPTPRYHAVARLFREQSRPRSQEEPAPATAGELAAAERELGCRFPISYCWFQLEFGEAPDGPLDIFSVRPTESSTMNIVGINLDARQEGYPRLPPHLIAFSDSGGGDLCCFDTAAFKGGECPVVWWDHESDEGQEPQVAGPSFLDWLELELLEIATEEKGSLLDSIPRVHLQWLREWFKQKE